eukprot:2991319-Rhodomonas_salina.1
MKAFWQTFALRKRARPFAPKDFAHACNHLEAYHKLEQVRPRLCFPVSGFRVSFSGLRVEG